MTEATQDARLAYLQELGAAHGFSIEEIEMNRRGLIHPGQAARGQRSGVGCAVFAVFLGLLFAAGGVGGALLGLQGETVYVFTAVALNGGNQICTDPLGHKVGLRVHRRVHNPRPAI